MRFIHYLLVFLIFLSACKKDEDNSQEIIFSEDYGDGMYILTKEGVSFYNYMAADSLRTITNNIYQSVNNRNINQPRSLHIASDKVFIVGDHVYIADIKTFADEGIIEVFSDPIDCKLIDSERLYVVDRGDATVKIINIYTKEQSGHIETGDNSSPISIEGSWYRAFIMNGGSNNFVDSSIISIDYFKSGIVVNEFSGKLDVGYNPNSAAFSTDHLWVLCKGIYDEQSLVNTESYIYKIAPWSNMINDSKKLSNIYNAENLTINNSRSRLFFSSTTGIYITDLTIYPNLHIPQINPSFIRLNTEKINDSTSVEYLYTNDRNQIGKILKYEAWTGNLVESIDLNNEVLDISFY